MERNSKIVLFCQFVLASVLASVVVLSGEIGNVFEGKVEIFSKVFWVLFEVSTLSIFLGLQFLKRRFFDRGWKYWLFMLCLSASMMILPNVTRKFVVGGEGQMIWSAATVSHDVSWLFAWIILNFIGRKYIEKSTDNLALLKSSFIDYLYFLVYIVIAVSGTTLAVQLWRVF